MPRLEGSDLPLRIVVDRPPAGVVFAVQLGRDRLLAPVIDRPDRKVFEFSVRAVTGGTAARLLGDAVQGPAAGRFVYVNSGQMAGQAGTIYSRRAKVPLGTITSALVTAAHQKPGARLEATMEGTGRDGGPTCASLKDFEGWRLVAK